MIKKIIGVMSCKGGVGKSTISVNLASYLANFHNKKVGLLDADIYGPNHPRLLGINNEYKIDFKDQYFHPILKYNILSMSMGYFLNDNSSVLLRGPIISNTIKYLYQNSKWGELDFLIIDFPPGTGDIYLSLLRDINFSGMIVITMPQMISVEDVKKSIIMLNKFNVNIYCLIENMKFYLCEKCGVSDYIYGNNNYAEKLANEFNIKNFYEFPINKYINISSNDGMPFIFNDRCKNFLSFFEKIYGIIL